MKLKSHNFSVLLLILENFYVLNEASNRFKLRGIIKNNGKYIIKMLCEYLEKIFIERNFFLLSLID